MLTYLEADGKLHIEAETQLESYAMVKWLNDNDEKIVKDAIDFRHRETNLPLGVS